MSRRQVTTIGAVRVVVAPGLAVALADLPENSVALDGVVQGPELDLERRRLSFDHHGDCLRLVTTATCQQVTDAVLLGLDPAGYTVYINDLDADTALAVAVLAHPGWLDGRTSTAEVLRRLVGSVGGRDAHGPAYPVVDPDLLAAFRRRVPLPARTTHAEGDGAAWMAVHLVRCVEAIAALVAELAAAAEISAVRPSPTDTREPSCAPGDNRDRTGHGSGDGNGDGGGGIGDRGGERVVAGGGDGGPGDGGGARDRVGATFEVTRSGTGWALVTSNVDVLDQVYAAGHRRVVMWRSLPDGSTAYTVARRSDLVDDFPVGPVNWPGTILGALAAREPGWGGGSSIGGAPRHPDGSRSHLTPDDVFTIVEDVVVNATARPRE